MSGRRTKSKNKTQEDQFREDWMAYMYSIGQAGSHKVQDQQEEEKRKEKKVPSEPKAVEPASGGIPLPLSTSHLPSRTARLKSPDPPSTYK